MKKTSGRVEAARNKVMPAAEDFVQMAADRVGPLTQSAAGRVTPLAVAAAATIAPFAHQAAEAVSPYAQQAAERLTPLADSAKQRGAQVAHDAVDRFGPALDEAFERVGPAVEAARGKVSDELLPKLTAALTAAAASPVVTEAVHRGQATIAAAKGDLVLPPEKPEKKKGRWLKRSATVAAIAAVAYVLARRFLGSKDSDWQAARPTAPYTPPKPSTAPTETSAADVAAADATATAGLTDADAGDDPQGGESTHSENVDANGAAEPDQPAEGGEAVEEPLHLATDETIELPVQESADLTSEPVEVITVAPAEDISVEPVELVSDETESVETASAVDPARYAGEGAYVGSEPPEGFFIKGNERSMKYHLPESSGYVRTIAEVWFSSEEAAQAAGFVRAQR